MTWFSSSFLYFAYLVAEEAEDAWALTPPKVESANKEWGEESAGALLRIHLVLLVFFGYPSILSFPSYNCCDDNKSSWNWFAVVNEDVTNQIPPPLTGQLRSTTKVPIYIDIDEGRANRASAAHSISRHEEERARDTRSSLFRKALEVCL